MYVISCMTTINGARGEPARIGYRWASGGYSNTETRGVSPVSADFWSWLVEVDEDLGVSEGSSACMLGLMFQ
jgi:hypothetical protein